MTLKKALGWTCFAMLCLALTVPASAQAPANRGKAEMKAGAGAITIDYGRPSLKGRDMLSQLQDGASWRMGMNQATTITTPVDLSFGATKIAKGSYSLFLTRSGAKYDLVFNSQTGQWGTQHDKAKDVARVAMKSETLPGAVETFTIELKEAPKGGIFSLSWGATKLSADFEAGK